MSSAIVMRTPGSVQALSKSRKVVKPSAGMCGPCGPKGFIKIHRIPDIRQRSPKEFGQRMRSFRRDPFQGNTAFTPFLRELGQYMNELSSELSDAVDSECGGSPDEWRLLADVTETQSAFIFEVDVPGMTKQDIKLKVTEEGVLAISAVRKAEQSTDNEEDEAAKKTVKYRERRFGKFSRTMRIPKSVDKSGITAEVKDGVMTINLPKLAEETPTEQQIVIN